MALSTLVRDALALAVQSIGLTSPDPCVGCVITVSDDRVLGRGRTQAVSGPHAELMEMRDAAANGELVHGAAVYVKLERRAHHRRTPPC